MKRTIMVICALLGIFLSGCAASQHASKPPTSKPTTSTGVTAPKVSVKTWHIAGFTVKEISLPADYKPNEGRELVVGTTRLEIGSAPPYTVTWQSLTSKHNGIVLEKGCPASTVSAYADLNDGYNLNNGYAPGYAGFVCAGKERSELLLVHMPDMTVSVFPLPGDPGGLTAWVSGAVDHPYLSWEVGINEITNSGIFDMTTGKPVAHLPTTSSQPPDAITLAAPNGTRYSISGNMVSKWNGSAFEPLGTIPNLRVAAVGNSGAVWADQPSLSNVFADTIVRETPGSAKIKSWQIVGTNELLESGFVSYTPIESLYGPVRIFFPEVDRTLTINNVSGQPMLAGFQRANDQILITTSVPPVVIEIIPPS